MSLQELTEVLIRHYEIKEGIYEALLEFRVGFGAFGPDDDKVPGVAAGVTKIGLAKVDELTGRAVDAATIWEEN